MAENEVISTICNRRVDLGGGGGLHGNKRGDNLLNRIKEIYSGCEACGVWRGGEATQIKKENTGWREE